VWPLDLGTHLYVKVPLIPGDSKGTVSVFKSSCHLRRAVASQGGGGGEARLEKTRPLPDESGHLAFKIVTKKGKILKIKP